MVTKWVQNREQKRNKIGTKNKPNRSQTKAKKEHIVVARGWQGGGTNTTQKHHKNGILPQIRIYIATPILQPYREGLPPFCPRQRTRTRAHVPGRKSAHREGMIV